jgi:hypothetical protein
MLAAWSANGLALVCGSQPSAGSQGKTFYSSTDGGVHWRLVGQVPFGPGYVYSLAATDPSNWILGDGYIGPLMQVTDDGGHHWRPATFTGRTSSVDGWVNVAFTSHTNAFATTSDLNGSVIALSHNEGRSWQEIAFPSPTTSLLSGREPGSRGP